MKISDKKKSSILVVLLLLSLGLLFVVKSEKDELQKNIDLVFTNAISESMGGLNRDYKQIDYEEKIQCYYQTLSNLHDALDVFYTSNYKEYDNLYLALNRLYIYILGNQGERYEIDDKLYIYKFLAKILVYPEDNQVISDFNSFLDSKGN
jgi:hypothetical protein